MIKPLIWQLCLQLQDVPVQQPNPGGQPSVNLTQQLHSLFKKLKGGADDFYAKLHALESCIVDEERKSSTLFAEVEQYPCAEKGRTIQARCWHLLNKYVR